MSEKNISRIRRAKKSRIHIRDQESPRLTVYRSSKHFYAQIFDSLGAKVIVSASTVEKDLKIDANNVAGAKEVGKRDITINAVAPGFITTDMTEQNKGVNAEYLMKEIPLGRFGEAEEVANLVNLLCSFKASYITGQTIHINGGLYM